MIGHVILVDEDDCQIGTMEKMEVHRKGLLHRAFSVLLFNSNGELLLQKRAKTKYHSGGLWTNSCCSHPFPDENVEVAANRRLKEELGIDVQPKFLYKFIYKVNLDTDLIEHEVDHVLMALFDGEPTINEEEVEDWKYVYITELLRDVQLNPNAYTPWLKLILTHKELALASA